MARKLKSDGVLFMATLLLVCTSVVMVYSASARVALEKNLDSQHYLIRQTLWAVMGVAALAIVMRIDYRVYRNELLLYSVLGAIAVLMLVALSRPAGNSANRWLNIGGLGIQPAEFAKLACVLFTAMILERRMHRINDVRYSIPPIAIVIGTLSALLLLQPDFGTPVMLVLVAGLMVFAAGLNYRYLLPAVAVAIPAAILLALTRGYRVDRLVAYFNPELDPLGIGYQVRQSLIAVGTGGVFGRGLTKGVQKLAYLPEPQNDFIYAVIAEELGLIGATGVLICFAVIAWRGLRITLRAEEPFGAFVALGITAMICAQAMINIGVVLSLLPNKGFTLPLVSAGGSSMLVCLVGLGILLNVSQHATSDS